MLTMNETCHLCEQGEVELWLCTDEVTIVLVCDECDCAWLDLTTWSNMDTPLFVDAETLTVRGTPDSLQLARAATHADLGEHATRAPFIEISETHG